MISVKKYTTAIVLIGLSSLCGLTACSSQPSYQGNASQQLMKQSSQWQYTQKDAEQVSFLTDLINVKELEPLIDLALVNNPSFNQVHLALKLANAQRNVTAASQWFSVDTDFSAQRSKNSDIQYSSSLAISWEADIWQRIADNVAAQEMTIASNQADYQSAKDTLVASVIRTYLTIILRQNLLYIEQQRLLILQNNEQNIIERYE